MMHFDGFIIKFMLALGALVGWVRQVYATQWDTTRFEYGPGPISLETMVYSFKDVLNLEREEEAR